VRAKDHIFLSFQSKFFPRKNKSEPFLRAFTAEILDNKLKYLEEQKQKIEQYLADMDKQDEEERIPGMDIKPENMPAHLEEIKKRVEKYKGYKERMEQTGETQILETDPECRSIRTKEGILPAYNIQTVVDDESHMIVAFETVQGEGEGERRNSVELSHL